MIGSANADRVRREFGVSIGRIFGRRIDPILRMATSTGRERTPPDVDGPKAPTSRRPAPRVRPRRLVAVVNRRPMDSTAPAALRGLSAQGRLHCGQEYEGRL